MINHADHLQTALRLTGADVPREGVHRCRTELLAAERYALRANGTDSLAAKFELAGEVGAEQFARLSEGQHPHTADQLIQHRVVKEYEGADGKSVAPVEHRAGWDATFSAPKSVSLTALVGGDDRVREAHRAAVNMALDELERYTQARIGGNHPAETTGQFVAAKFEHDTARPVDGYAAPQLHTHTVIFNMTERGMGLPAPCNRKVSSTASSSPPLSINPN